MKQWLLWTLAGFLTGTAVERFWYGRPWLILLAMFLAAVAIGINVGWLVMSIFGRHE